MQVYTTIVYPFIVSEHLGCFYFLDIVNNTVMNMDVQISKSLFFGYVARNRIARSCSNSLFNFLKNHHSVFHSSCPILHSHQVMLKDSNFSTFSPTLVFFWLLSSYFYKSYSNGHGMESHCGTGFI